MAPSAPSMLHHLDPSRRPRESRSTTVLPPALDQAVFFLCNHAVTLSAADGVNVSSPMAVGKALEAHLSVPVHSLRVTAHHPEHFFVTFTQSAHQVNVVRRGSIRVDGACFNIIPWHEHDLATFDSLLLHVHVVIEKVPMHFWSVEERRRSSVGRQKSCTAAGVGGVRHAHPCRQGGGLDAAITALPPLRPERSAVVRSDDDDSPFPMVAPASWKMGVEDGQRSDRMHRLARAPVASLGCRGGPRDGRSRDRDDEGGPGAGGHRSWKDVLLRRGASRAPPRATPSQRRRSRSPPARRGSRESSGRRSGARRATASARRQSRPHLESSTPAGAPKDTGSAAAATQPAPVARNSTSGKDPVKEFFRTAKKPTIASVIVDGLAADVHIAAEAAVVAPLEFVDANLLQASGETVQLDAFSPTLSAAASDLG
ncbi:hypothetical protein D1007_36151 [Hordeum vulgare]|nr:hypothetical protein D1007_36151 [Hordeum vulgare]